MSLFGKSVEITELQEALKKSKEAADELRLQYNEVKIMLDETREANRELGWKLKVMEKEADLANEKKLQELRKTMQESLIKSDLLRTEALAKLEVYEKTDTKADANTIKEMVGQLIGAIGKQGINVIK